MVLSYKKGFWHFISRIKIRWRIIVHPRIIVAQRIIMAVNNCYAQIWGSTWIYNTHTYTLTNLSTTTNSFRFNNCDDGILSTVFCETTFALFPITIFISLYNVTSYNNVLSRIEIYECKICKSWKWKKQRILGKFLRMRIRYVCTHNICK